MSLLRWEVRPTTGYRRLKCDGCGKESESTEARQLPPKWFTVAAAGQDEDAHACSNACVQRAADLQTKRMENKSCDCEDCNGN